MIFRDDEAWRPPFQIVGAVGVFWAIAWCVFIPKGSIIRIDDIGEEQRVASNWFVELLGNRRFWAMVVMIISINTSWQLIRAWLPKFLQQGRGYSESSALLFNSAYYLATDVGCIGAGFIAMWLTRKGMSVHGSRLLTYAGCSLLACCTCLAAVLPQGGLLLAVLLIVGAGTLGLFPCYYSFTQELSSPNLGKVTGILAFLGWIASSPVHRFFGSYVDRTKSFDFGIALVGLAPLLLRSAPAQIDALDQQWQTMQRWAGEATELRNTPPVSAAQASAALKAASDRLGDKAKLNVQGDRAVLSVNGVGTDALRDWLKEVRVGARARLVEATLTRATLGFNGTVVLALGAAT